MAKAILMMLLVVANSNACAQWFVVSGNAESTIYANPKTVSNVGGKAKMWHLVDFRTDQELKNFKSYLSLRAQTESDCKVKQLRLLYVTYHSENMVGGTIVETENVPTNWTPISPGSGAEVLWKIACKML